MAQIYGWAVRAPTVRGSSRPPPAELTTRTAAVQATVVGHLRPAELTTRTAVEQATVVGHLHQAELTNRTAAEQPTVVGHLCPAELTTRTAGAQAAVAGHLRPAPDTRRVTATVKTARVLAAVAAPSVRGVGRLVLVGRQVELTTRIAGGVEAVRRDGGVSPPAVMEAVEEVASSIRPAGGTGHQARTMW